MIKISSIILARDEEENIRRCIESQSECIDEILIFVDDRTIDKTFEITQSYPSVKSYLINWDGFAKTKQKALQSTSNDWVFWIDADEALTKELRAELCDFKKSEPKYNSWSVPRHTIPGSGVPTRSGGKCTSRGCRPASFRKPFPSVWVECAVSRP